MLLLKKELKNKILVLTLSDTKTRNAFSPQMASEFKKALKEQSFSGVILKAEGKIFCSGGHLPFYKNLKTKEEGLKHNQKITKILNEFENLSVPKVCLVEGLCVGGGMELMASFDKVYASPQALFGLWQRRVGLTFGWGGEQRLRKRVSEKNLNNWLLYGETLDVYRAQDIGIVDGVFLKNQLQEKAIQWIEKISQLGQHSLEAIYGQSGHQSHVFQNLWLEADHRKALEKFTGSK